MSFVKITTASDLPATNEAREFTFGDKTICVANVNGRLCAIENACLHRGGPLGQGTVESGKIVCPWHGWQWNPMTGEAAHDAKAKVAVYELRLENGDVLIEI